MECYAGIAKGFLLNEERRQYEEDVHLHSPRAKSIRHALKHWGVQRDYRGISWDGVELFHFHLASQTRQVGIESVGWYKYPSSKREDMDGKDWRLVIPDLQGAVAVNCHSLLHDDVWSLTTTVYSTQDIDLDVVEMLGDDDHWGRTLKWTLAVAKVLETHGYDYRVAKASILGRMRRSVVARQMAEELLPVVRRSCEKVVPRRLPLREFSIGVSKSIVPKRKVGYHFSPELSNLDYSVITLHPQAFHDPGYTRAVVTHELIHLALGTTCDQVGAHGAEFQKIADLSGLPKEYQD